MNYHQSWVYGSSDISSEWIPTLRIEEVPELSEVVIHQKLGCSKVEPGIELVDD